MLSKWQFLLGSEEEKWSVCLHGEAGEVDNDNNYRGEDIGDTKETATETIDSDNMLSD
jgi:hypothetical protein